MAIVTGLGSSTEEDLESALVAAAREALAKCPKPTLALVFVTYTYPTDRLLSAIAALRSIARSTSGALSLFGLMGRS